MASFEHIAQRLVTSVPSIGGARATTLEQALQRVARAERELADARSEARHIGRAAGKKLSTLFEDSAFVRRSSSESWIEETRSEAYTAGFEKACYYFERALRPQSEKEQDPFYQLAAGLVGKGLPRRDIADAPIDPVEARMQEILESRRTSLAPNAAIGGPTTSAEFVSALHAAAARARSPTDADPPPREQNALAKAILKAGEERRNPKPWQGPKNERS